MIGWRAEVVTEEQIWLQPVKGTTGHDGIHRVLERVEIDVEPGL